jgi:transcription antitermination factor NusG
MGLNTKIDPYPYLKKGVRVEVRSGPLKGIQGLVEDRARKHRLILQVDALGQAVSVEVDAAIVEVAE